MKTSEIASAISDKNEFAKLCRELEVPMLASFPFFSADEYFSLVRPLISWERPQLLKPASDRAHLEDRRRRFFLCKSVQELDACITQQCYGIGEGAAEFQIQEYMDFRKVAVIYYNTAFKISDELNEHLTTRQIVNLSAIEHNLPAAHWGNMHATAHPLLDDGKEFARKLARRYKEMGYRGELGIDFGICGAKIFFLETNARINNATRLSYYLLALGLDADRSRYIYIKNSVLRFLGNELDEFRQRSGISFHDHPFDKTLIVSSDPLLIGYVHELIESLARSTPPCPA